VIRARWDRLSYANVVATVVLLVALGGGAYAALKLPRNSVTSKNIENGAVKSRDIGINQVKARNIARKAVHSKDIKNGQIDNVDIGGGQVTAGKIAIGGVNSANIQDGQVGSVDLAPAETFHLVGAAGEPSFGNGGEGDCLWSNFTSGSITPPDAFAPAGFYRDPYGVVHLTGAVQAEDGSGGDRACGGVDGPASDQTIFSLPAADQPPHLLAFAVALGDAGTGQLEVNGSQTVVEGSTTIPPGAVVLAGGNGPVDRLSLDGVDFRAG
jgi:hypothetical protein